MGFVSMVAMGLYLLISIGVVVWAIRYARNNGKSAKRWGWGAALGMYLLVFWDWIPTVVAHKYYCSIEAGFWVYKTPEQWKKENPGVLGTLSENKDIRSIRQGDMENFTDTHFLNPCIKNVLKKRGPYPLNQWRWEQEVVDSKTNDVLARNIDFSSGNGNIGGEPPIRFWLQSEGCTGGSAVNGYQFYTFRHQFLGK